MASIALAGLDSLTRHETLVKISEKIVIEHNLNSLFERLAGLLGRVLVFDLVLFSVNDLDGQSIAVHVRAKTFPGIGSLQRRHLPRTDRCPKGLP
jgi:hypothetical protein